MQVSSNTERAVWLALTSEASEAQAQALALALLERRLVACVSLQPVRSHYHWQGRLEQASEVQLLLKTDAAHLADLEAAVHALHSYDTPEWLLWPAQASGPYGRWLGGELAPQGPWAVSPDAGPPKP